MMHIHPVNSSLIQTILSVLDFHQISRLPPPMLSNTRTEVNGSRTDAFANTAGRELHPAPKNTFFMYAIILRDMDGYKSFFNFHLSLLVYSRIIAPLSKLSSLEIAQLLIKVCDSVFSLIFLYPFQKTFYPCLCFSLALQFKDISRQAIKLHSSHCIRSGNCIALYLTEYMPFAQDIYHQEIVHPWILLPSVALVIYPKL